MLQGYLNKLKECLLNSDLTKEDRRKIQIEISRVAKDIEKEKKHPV